MVQEGQSKKTGAAVKPYGAQEKKETYFQIKIPVAVKFPFLRVNNISPTRTRLLNTVYKIVHFRHYCRVAVKKAVNKVAKCEK